MCAVDHNRDKNLVYLDDINGHNSEEKDSNNGTVDKSDTKSIQSKKVCISSDRKDPITTKFTLMMLTIIFILSYLPCLLLQIWQVLTIEFYFFYSTVGFQFGVRAYFLNAAINPVIYGLFNSRFRQFLIQLLCRVCTRRK